MFLNYNGSIVGSKTPILIIKLRPLWWTKSSRPPSSPKPRLSIAPRLTRDGCSGRPTTSRILKLQSLGVCCFYVCDCSLPLVFLCFFGPFFVVISSGEVLPLFSIRFNFGVKLTTAVVLARSLVSVVMAGFTDFTALWLRLDSGLRY